MIRAVLLGYICSGGDRGRFHTHPLAVNASLVIVTVLLIISSLIIPLVLLGLQTYHSMSVASGYVVFRYLRLQCLFISRYILILMEVAETFWHIKDGTAEHQSGSSLR